MVALPVGLDPGPVLPRLQLRLNTLALNQGHITGSSRGLHGSLLGLVATAGSRQSLRSCTDEQHLRSFCANGQLEQALDALVCMDQKEIVPSVSTYRYFLRACTKKKALSKARQVHAHIVKNGLECDSLLGNAVVNMLVKCGSLSEAAHVFAKLPLRTALSWSAIISGYSENGQDEEALKVYWQMIQEGAEPNKFTFIAVLKVCGNLADLRAGKQIHADIVKYSFESDLFVGTTLVDMYTKCGSMLDARRVFDGLPHRDVITWNAMITGYAQHGQGKLALQLYADMHKEGVSPDARTFVGVAKAYGGLAAMEVSILSDGQLIKEAWLGECKALHADIDKKGCASDLYVANSLVYMYANCGSILDARHVFDTLSQPTVVSWTTMIAGYAQQEKPYEALRLYAQMQEEGVKPNDRTFVSVLKACASLAAEEDATVISGEALKLSCLQQGREIHAEILRCGFGSDLFVCNTLLHMYASCGSLSEARSLFTGLPHCDVVSWNAVIGAYAQQEQGEQALELYAQMLYSGIKPNDRTFVSILKACSSLGASENSGTVSAELLNAESLFRVKEVHAELLRSGYDSDAFIGNTLLHFYAHCESLADAQKVFEELAKRDVVSFSVMIAAWAKQDQGEQALKLYAHMQEDGVRPDEHTYMSLLKACVSLATTEFETLVDGHAMKVESLSKGKVIHAQLVQSQWESELFIATTLVDMYANCGSMVDAENVFDMLSVHDVVAFNAMISGYAQQNQGDKALELYVRMQVHERPSEATFVGILQACSNTGSIVLITKVHEDAVESGFSQSVPVVNSLIHAYSRCGSLDEAQAVFNSLQQPDRVSWNTLIAGYARLGDYVKSLWCFKKMQEARIEPDVVTFVSVLSACSHAGMVEAGLGYFESMYRQHNVCPVAEHYVSIIDLLGRAGLLSRVQSLLASMTVQPNLHVWMAALGACRKFVNVELGRQSFEHAIRIEPKHSSAYVLMSNIYAHAHMWEDAAEIERMRIRAGAYKKPGQSWIERKEKVHSFKVGSASDQQSNLINDTIRELAVLIRKDPTS